MKKKESEIASFLLLAFVLCACNSVISKTTEAATSNPPISIPTIPSTMTYAASPAFQRQATATW